MILLAFLSNQQQTNCWICFYLNDTLANPEKLLNNVYIASTRINITSFTISEVYIDKCSYFIDYIIFYNMSTAITLQCI